MRNFYVLRSISKSTMAREEKIFSKKHDFEEKNIFKKQIFEKPLRTKNHVFTHFAP